MHHRAPGRTMPRKPLRSDQDTDRIEPQELADSAVYHATVETTEHRALGVVVSGSPLLPEEVLASAEAPRPWWRFWSR